jgi:phosphonate transport system permease protein
VGVVVLLLAITWHLGINFTTLAAGLGDIAEYIHRYSTPNFTDWSRYLALMGVTLATALWGTVIAVGFAFFLAPLAARNFSPHASVYRGARETLNFMRAMPDLVLALMFVAAIGLGPFPGALALGVHSAGFLGKFLAECMERVDKDTCEGVASTGASFVQRLAFVAWPSILREGFGYLLFILDRNVRMASMLGMVGAGGIGLELYNSLRMFNYDQSAAMILVILAALLLIDHSSSWLRRRLE